MTKNNKRASAKHRKTDSLTVGRRTLPPDPERENNNRAAKATDVIEAYRKICGIEVEDALADLMADLMHLCDRDTRLGNFEGQLVRAYRHYREETATDAEYERLFD